MIARKLELTKPLSYDCLSVPTDLNVYSLGYLCEDLKKFLYKYFDGSFDIEVDAPRMAKAYASLDVISMIARKAMEAALGAFVIFITVSVESGHALFKFSAPKAAFSKELIDALSALGKDEKAKIEADETTIVYKAKLLKLPICNIRANSARTLYRVLEHWFSI